MRQNLQNVVLVCPDNDAESRLILLMAYQLGMRVVRSGQGLGATLESERGDLAELIFAAAFRGDEVWIVEIPGPDIEERLRQRGLRITIIDHHSYGGLDRSHGPEGQILPSSLHQFMALAEINDHWLRTHGLKPVVVHGIGILDARFVQGLRDEGYTHEQICLVLNFREACARAGFPDFDKAQAAARHAWDLRQMVAGYIVVRSSEVVAIRGAVATITIYENCDTQPLIICDKNGAELFVQNVDPEIVELLQSAIPVGFTFGSGRCWGVNNQRSRTTYTLDHILGVLS